MMVVGYYRDSMNDRAGVKVITSTLIRRLKVWFRGAMQRGAVGGGRGSAGRSEGS